MLYYLAPLQQGIRSVSPPRLLANLTVGVSPARQKIRLSLLVAAAALLAGTTVLRFLLPLVITREQIDRGVDTLAHVLGAAPRSAAV